MKHDNIQASMIFVQVYTLTHQFGLVGGPSCPASQSRSHEAAESHFRTQSPLGRAIFENIPVCKINSNCHVKSGLPRGIVRFLPSPFSLVHLCACEIAFVLQAL